MPRNRGKPTFKLRDLSALTLTKEEHGALAKLVDPDNEPLRPGAMNSAGSLRIAAILLAVFRTPGRFPLFVPCQCVAAFSQHHP
jgi:hypothetical protein